MVQAHCSAEMVDVFTIVQEQKCLWNISVLHLKWREITKGWFLYDEVLSSLFVAKDIKQLLHLIIFKISGWENLHLIPKSTVLGTLWLTYPNTY